MMLAKTQPRVFSGAASKRVPLLASQPKISRASVQARAASQGAAQEQINDATRRQILLSVAGISVAGLTSSITACSAFADEAPAGPSVKTFLGMASPPTSYGGYGGNANETPKYSFEYPADWKTEQPSKVEKGTQGIDGRVVNPKGKDLRAFVITLGRAGEDNKSFILRDTESTFAGFAGADYNLQDALSSASSIDRTSRNIGGIDFYDYDIDSPDFHYLSSVAVKDGKVFALFVRSPARQFKPNEKKLRHIIETFRLL